jgi:hypothetical protein
LAILVKRRHRPSVEDVVSCRHSDEQIEILLAVPGQLLLPTIPAAHLFHHLAVLCLCDVEFAGLGVDVRNALLLHVAAHHIVEALQRDVGGDLFVQNGLAF